MAKVNPHIDLGTGYIQLSRLPFDQAMRLRSHLPITSVVSLSTPLGNVHDAVQYSEYEYWFDYQFSQSWDSDFEV